jgi:hypothetical protein
VLDRHTAWFLSEERNNRIVSGETPAVGRHMALTDYDSRVTNHVRRKRRYCHNWRQERIQALRREAVLDAREWVKIRAWIELQNFHSFHDDYPDIYDCWEEAYWEYYAHGRKMEGARKKLNSGVRARDGSGFSRRKPASQRGAGPQKENRDARSGNRSKPSDITGAASSSGTNTTGSSGTERGQKHNQTKLRHQRINIVSPSDQYIQCMQTAWGDWWTPDWEFPG